MKTNKLINQCIEKVQDILHTLKPCSVQLFNNTNNEYVICYPNVVLTLFLPEQSPTLSQWPYVLFIENKKTDCTFRICLNNEEFELLLHLFESIYIERQNESIQNFILEEFINADFSD
jgi:hypothetical protein